MNHGDPNDGDASGVTSTSLLARINAHDERAWEQLARLYSPVVYSWCRTYGVFADDASDVMQEVFQAVYRGIDSFRRQHHGDTFRGWLWTITRNKIRDLRRAERKQAAAIGGTDALRQWQELPEEEPMTQVSNTDGSRSLPVEALERVRAGFEPRSWQAFWRTAIDGAATADVASELDMSRVAVRKAKSRVLCRLREEFRGVID